MVRYPLPDCVARPGDPNGETHPLVDHLLAVARAMGKPDGDYEERLRFLAGLLHDAGKARTAWQDYIRRPPESRGPGVPHAFAGAMLLAVVLKELVKAWPLPRRPRERLLYLGLSLIYFIYEHHNRVPDILGDLPPWQGNFPPGELLAMDLEGLVRLVNGFAPELAGLDRLLEPIGLDIHFQELVSLWPTWQNVTLNYITRIQSRGNIYAESASICARYNLENHRLIAADRLHAARFTPGEEDAGIIPADRSRAILKGMEDFCQDRRNQLSDKGACRLLLEKREACRLSALAAFREQGQNHRLFTLELPTGYGKTLTSLSVALAAIAEGMCSRIIYVAPYISILSQAATEIATATGLEVVAHHHLASLERAAGKEDREEQEGIEIDSWLAPVVATTYNKFFQALFPERAHHTLRLKGLHRAFVVIDEPQTIATTSWNPFLTLAEALAEEVDCRLLFATATLPDLTGGLLSSSAASFGREIPLFSRYLVENAGELGEEGVAELALSAYREQGSVAVIMNTIQDAANVYALIKDRLPGGRAIYFLSGHLTPLHKQERIAAIRQALEDNARALVVCTQVLEAGVDLSFRVVLRALPLVPSIIQAAGRCNRHGEGGPGKVYVFDFRRGNAEDTRRFVYRDPVQREVTDLLSRKYVRFEETQAAEIVAAFYSECLKRNTNQAPLDKIKAAAGGYWSELAGLDPFGPDLPECGIFIPWLPRQLPDFVARGLADFEITRPDQLWERYVSRRYLPSLDFTARRRFMALMYQFMVQVPLTVGAELGEPAPGRALLRLRYPSLYREDTGLALPTAGAPMIEQFL